MKKILSIILIIALLFTLCACGGTPQTQGETKEIVDCIGRTVTIPKNPERVACMYASTAHLMAMMGESEKIVGAPNGVKRDILMQMVYPEIVNIAEPFQSGSINVEELLRINADVALVRYSTAENPAETEKLDKLGIPYVVVDYYTMDELKKAVSVIGEVFDNKEKADAFNAFFDDTLALVDTRLEGLSEEEKPLVYHSVNEAARTDVEGDICSEITARAGIINASVANGLVSGGDKTYTTLEEIYKWDPDAIIANEYAVTDYILSEAKWAGLKAVTNKRVYTLPIGATRWCHPGSMEAHMATLAIANLFYPERFSDFDIKAYTKQYYKDFFGLDLDDETIESLFSGQGMRLASPSFTVE